MQAARQVRSRARLSILTSTFCISRPDVRSPDARRISRGQEGDAKLHRISQHYAMLEALTGHQEHCSQLPELRTPDRARNDLVQDAARERLLMQGRRGATLGIRCKRQSVASSAKSASR